MYIFKFLVGFFIFLMLIGRSFSAENNNVLEYLKFSDNYTSFYKLIKKAKYEELFLSEAKFKKVLYIPDNNAFDNLPSKLKKYIWDNADNNAAKKLLEHIFTQGPLKKYLKILVKK